MADGVGYSTGTGITIAADEIGTAFYQRVKVVVGADGTNSGDVGPTNGLPVTGAVGVSGTVSVLGTVSVSGAVPVSGTITILPTTLTVNTAGTIAGASVTVQQGISVSAVVSGTVTISPTTLTVNTAGTVAGASITIQQGVSVSAVVSGTVTINPTILTVNTAATVAGASVTIQQGASVSVAVVPTVQSILTIVTQLGTQMVSIAQTSVSVAVIPTVSTIVTILGTQMVSMAQTSVSIGALPTVNTVVTMLGTVSVSQVGYLYTTTGVTTGTAQAVWIMNPTTVTATITVSQPFGDAIAFSFTTVSAPTVITPALCNVAWLGTTVQTSMYVVPAGRRLQIQAVVCRVQNTAASVGFGRVEVEVRASLSSSVTVGPVILFGQAVSPTSGTNAAYANVYDVRMDVSTTMSVGFAYKASGGTGHLVGFVVQGVLY